MFTTFRKNIVRHCIVAAHETENPRKHSKHKKNIGPHSLGLRGSQFPRGNNTSSQESTLLGAFFFSSGPCIRCITGGETIIRHKAPRAKRATYGAHAFSTSRTRSTRSLATAARSSTSRRRYIIGSRTTTFLGSATA